MGCASSKLDDLPAVALCRERCGFLDEAIKLRFALAEAHVGYIHSLKSIGPSLHHFINQNQHGSVGFSDSPPPEKKHLKGGGNPSNPTSPNKIHSHSKSNSGSGSHLQFNSDSEDDDEDDSGSHLHLSDHSSPMHHHHNQHHMDSDEGHGGHFGYDSMNYGSYATNPGMMGSYPGGGFMNMNYMKNKGTTSSVVYEQRPKSPQRVYMGESSSSYTPYPYPINNSYTPYYGYPNYGGGSGGGGGVVSGYYGSSPPQYGSNPPQPEASTSKPPPPPPSPPRASAWDYLNLFQSNDKYYPTYTPSRDSKELREEEGIPDLEEEDYQHEVVKEVHGNQKFVDGNYSPSSLEEEDSKSGGASSSGSGGNDNGGGGGGHQAEASLYQTRPSVETGGMEYEVHVVDKKVVNNERSDERSNTAARSNGPRDALEVAREIEAQFVRASESGHEIAKMLEVGKRPYRPKHVSSKMLHVVTPPSSLVSKGPSTSKTNEPSSSTNEPSATILELEEEVAMRSGNLSSTLHKLHLWEKKLYSEVKEEEKMRVLHDRKVRKLKRLDEKGAEAHKIDATRTIIRSLSTKIRMAIQVVDKISVTINKIRDEELWPQLNELIQGLARMWKCMLECHHNQCQAIRDARNLGYAGTGKKTSDAHLEATLQLEHELLNWTLKFSSWVVTQKGYVRALNNWLMRCLYYEPEETPDGIVPFSPGRIGAPPVFVICNQWSQALERISEKEVVNSLRMFAMSVLHLWEQDKLEMRQRMVANKDLERKVRSLDKEDQKIQKEIQALDKKVILALDNNNNNSLSEAGHIVYQSDTSSKSLQGSLQHIFEAMERFTADSMKAYEELMQRTEEERVRQTQETTS